MGRFRKIDPPMVIGINHWITIAIVGAVGIGILIGLEKRRP